jgi:RNA 3'-terminal phosphate cyclase (ATP)
MIEIDGSYGEGGGQLLRTALSLAAITGQGIRIERIRARRSRPGLRAQHLAAVRAVAEICAAQVEGAELDSRSLTFVPSRPPQPGQYRWNIGTAGATSLVFQTVLWPLASAGAPSQVTVTGGTHVDWSPPIDYVQQVYLPALSTVSGASVAQVVIEEWGWYPRGGGTIQATIAGDSRLRGLRLSSRGSLCKVSVTSAASNLPEHVRQRQAKQADHILRKQGIKPQVKSIDPPSPGQGTAVFVLAEYDEARAGFTSYGRIRKPAERVAEEACRGFARFHKRGRPVDRYLADQLLLPLALADGDSQYAASEITQHLVTNAWLIQQFLDVRIVIEGEEREPGIVQVVHL